MPKTVPIRPISSQTLIFSPKTPLQNPQFVPKSSQKRPGPSQTVPFVSRPNFLTFAPSHVHTFHPCLPPPPNLAAPAIATACSAINRSSSVGSSQSMVVSLALPLLCQTGHNRTPHPRNSAATPIDFQGWLGVYSSCKQGWKASTD